MEQKGFIFIPDISGFTNFVNSVELSHSRHVIKELLEVILDSNQMELKVSEVEGDAILFYRLGEIPDLEVVYAQVEECFYYFTNTFYNMKSAGPVTARHVFQLSTYH
jgi:hypothetical protein